MSEAWDKINKQLKSRSSDTISSILTPFYQDQKSSHLLITSSSDIGVIRNGGRRGANFAPEAIINVLKKCIIPTSIDSIQYAEVSNHHLEQIDFPLAQQKEIEQITTLLDNHQEQTIHIGGGHDHIYPYVKAIAQKYPNVPINIVNIDAHLDTRIDQLPHSGTPFRQILIECPQCELYQIGIHRYANPPSNYQNLDQRMHILESHSIAADSTQFGLQVHSFLPANKTGELWILSVDIDGLHASFMEAVSAVNHHGLDCNQFRTVMDCVKQRSNQAYLGLYEYNPIYDNLSQKGARAIVDAVLYWIE